MTFLMLFKRTGKLPMPSKWNFPIFAKCNSDSFTVLKISHKTFLYFSTYNAVTFAF